MHLTRQCSILNKIHNCFNINPITCCEQFLSEKHLNLCEILIPLRRFKASVMKWGNILPNKKRKISSTETVTVFCFFNHYGDSFHDIS